MHIGVSLGMMKKHGRASQCPAEPAPNAATKMSSHSGPHIFPGPFSHRKMKLLLYQFPRADRSRREVARFLICLFVLFISSCPSAALLFACLSPTSAEWTAAGLPGREQGCIYGRAVQQPLAAGIPKIPSEIADGISLQ